MIRYPSFLVIFLILIVGITLYQIKFSINENEIVLKNIKAKIDDTKSDIEILNAEISYLKRPERIEKIEKYYDKNHETFTDCNFNICK